MCSFLSFTYTKRRGTKCHAEPRYRCSEIFFLDPFRAKTVDLKIGGCTNLIKIIIIWTYFGFWILVFWILDLGFWILDKLGADVAFFKKNISKK